MKIKININTSVSWLETRYKSFSKSYYIIGIIGVSTSMYSLYSMHVCGSICGPQIHFIYTI